VVTHRRVIDVSGDGEDSDGGNVPVARNNSRCKWHHYQWLADCIGFPNLQAYYQATVIGGEGAFVEPARNILDFADAMHRKLLREILQSCHLIGARQTVISRSADKDLIWIPPHASPTRKTGFKGASGDWEVIIGLESMPGSFKAKLFSGARLNFGGEPTIMCPSSIRDAGDAAGSS